jgi:hypothetical protein
MSTLAPCPGCNRHVRSGDTCPFCKAAQGAETTTASPLARTSRAALFAIAAAACGGPTAHATMYGGPPPEQDASAPATPTPLSDNTAHVSAYGGPPQPTVAPPQPKH